MTDGPFLYRLMLEEFQTVKPYLRGDFYPRSPCDTAADRVLAYQLARPDLGRGVIFAFRRQACETAAFTYLTTGPAKAYFAGRLWMTLHHPNDTPNERPLWLGVVEHSGGLTPKTRIGQEGRITHD